MWALDNGTPYSVERNWLRDKQGRHLWLVAVQATYDIGPQGALNLADEQPPPILAPVYFGDPATSSLQRDSDLLALKPSTDVLLDACAHAPHGRAAATVHVSLRIDKIEKALVVHGPRVYYKGPVGLTTSAPRPFTVRPIRYEWAYGGSDVGHSDPRKDRLDARNPVGKGFATDSARLENQPAHCIEYVRGSPEQAGPAGFGPLASFWAPRLALAGTYDDRWQQKKKPLLPDDYDDAFALAAPRDQRPERYLHGGETVALSNLTPGGSLTFQLPKVLLIFRTKIAGRSEEHRGHLSTVFVAPETMKLSMVWQTTLPVVSRELEYLDKTSVHEKTYLR